jgi:hypothetical protein
VPESSASRSRAATSGTTATPGDRARERAEGDQPGRASAGSCYALRSFVEGDQRWKQPWLRWDHLVVLPGAKIPQDFALPDCPRWKVTDKSELTELASRLRAVLLDRDTTNPFLKLEGIEQLRTVLSGRGLTQRDIVARSQENEDAAQILTEHQAVILDAIRLLNRIEVRGGAGSGKTFLAVEQARRLSADGKRVALVCYSHGLASYLRRLTSSWSRRQQPAYVGEFHSLGVHWGALWDLTSRCALRRVGSSGSTTCPAR